MKRLSVCFVALAFTGLAAVGCSKGNEVATPSVPNVPNVDNIQADAAKCTELAASWATVVVPGADGAKVKQQIDDLKAQVPDSVKDDLTVIGDGVTGASSDPMKLAEFYSSPEFTAANENVTKYLTVECSTVGS
jgi:hypothetical protein